VYAQLLACSIILALDDSTVSVQELVHGKVSDGPVQGEVEVAHLVLRRDAGDRRDEARQQCPHARFAGHRESRRHMPHGARAASVNSARWPVLGGQCSYTPIYEHIDASGMYNRGGAFESLNRTHHLLTSPAVARPVFEAQV
jgi:hypothetical protein